MATVTTTAAQPIVTPRRNWGRLIEKILLYTALTLLTLIFLFPLYWMATAALKQESQIFRWPPIWFPNPITFDNFVAVFNHPQLPFTRFVGNTLILEVGMITGRLISCTLVAYGFARLNAPGKNLIFGLLLSTLMLPGIATLIPRYVLFSQIGWVNTYAPLIVPAWFGEAYAIFLMRQFFMTLPKELDESARIDGASQITIITRIIVPLSVPVLAVIAVLSFKDIWNDFFGPLLYVNKADMYTVAIGLAYFNGQTTVKMGQLMAASTAMLIPLIIVFAIAQRAFVEGISMTGLKG